LRHVVVGQCPAENVRRCHRLCSEQAPEVRSPLHHVAGVDFMNLRFGRKVCNQIFSHTFTDEYLSTKITGANPTTSIYNASVVNFYNAIGNLARFENNFFIILLKPL
jgi:hypothetical protein